MPRSKNITVRPSGEWLTTQYLKNGIDANALARMIGVDGKTVWKWLRVCGVTLRGRGFGKPSLHFKAGEPSLLKGRRRPASEIEHLRQYRKSRPDLKPYLKDGIHWMKATGRKPWNWQGGLTPERQAFYRSLEWKTAADAVRKRDNYTCQCCFRHQNEFRAQGQKRRFHVHHIDSFKIVERRKDVDNLILMCSRCHYWAHGKDNPDCLFLGIGHTREQLFVKQIA